MTVTGWMTGEGKRGIRVATIVNATLSHGGPGSGEIFHTNNKEIKKSCKNTREYILAEMICIFSQLVGLIPLSSGQYGAPKPSYGAPEPSYGGGRGGDGHR